MKILVYSTPPSSIRPVAQRCPNPIYQVLPALSTEPMTRPQRCYHDAQWEPCETPRCPSYMLVSGSPDRLVQCGHAFRYHAEVTQDLKQPLSPMMNQQRLSYSIHTHQLGSMHFAENGSSWGLEVNPKHYCILEEPPDCPSSFLSFRGLKAKSAMIWIWSAGK
jgi:hypothetical protein